MKTEKTLEILIDGDLKETVSLLVGSPIEVIGINCKNGKAVKSQLLGEKQRYSFDFEDYKKIVRNSLERLYPGKNIELKEYQKMIMTLEQIQGMKIPAGAVLEVKTDKEIVLGYFDAFGTSCCDGTLHLRTTKKDIDHYHSGTEGLKVYRISSIEDIKVLEYKK